MSTEFTRGNDKYKKRNERTRESEGERDRGKIIEWMKKKTLKITARFPTDLRPIYGNVERKRKDKNNLRLKYDFYD